MHVEQREPVGDDVVAGPVPGVGERVEVRRDRAPRQHDALRRPGRAGRVDDDRGRLVVGLARPVAGGGEIDVVEHDLRRAVGQDVLELALARLRVDRDDRHARRPARRRPRPPSPASCRPSPPRASHRRSARPPRPPPRAAARSSARRLPPGPPRGRPAPPNLSRARRKFYPVHIWRVLPITQGTMPGATTTARPRRRRRTREPDARQRPADPAGLRRRSGGGRRGRGAGRFRVARST